MNGYMDGVGEGWGLSEWVVGVCSCIRCLPFGEARDRPEPAGCQLVTVYRSGLLTGCAEEA